MESLSYKNGYLVLLVLHLLPLLNSWIIAEMQPAKIFSICISLIDVHLNWLNSFHFLIIVGGLPVFLTDCIIFVTIPKCYSYVYGNSFFPRTSRLLNTLAIEYFPLTYDLNGFKSAINRHLSTSFLNSFPVCFNLFALLFLVTP